MRIVLAGQEAAGLQVLRALAASRHTVVAVLTQEPRKRGAPASLGPAARATGIETVEAASVQDSGFASRVRSWEVDLFLNVHSLHIVPDEVLCAPAIGSFNLHPGPLPEYSGLNTVSWALYNGEPEYGVTVHWMVRLVDAGPIAFEERFPIGATATALTLSAECTRRGVGLILRLIDAAAEGRGSIPAVDQDLSRRRYYGRRDVPQGGRIEWTRPAREVARLVRAFDYGPFVSPWGRPQAKLGEALGEISGVVPTGEITDAPPGTMRSGAGGGLEVACLDEWARVTTEMIDVSK